MPQAASSLSSMSTPALARFFFLFSSLLALVLAGAGCAAETGTAAGPMEVAPAASESAATASGRVGSHGMVLFGTRGRGYLSHIPMFQAPHDVQAIFEVEM